MLVVPPGSWNAGNTVLTCTPSLALPGNSVIAWWILGYDAGFQPLTGTTNGTPGRDRSAYPPAP